MDLRTFQGRVDIHRNNTLIDTPKRGTSFSRTKSMRELKLSAEELKALEVPRDHSVDRPSLAEIRGHMAPGTAGDGLAGATVSYQKALSAANAAVAASAKRETWEATHKGQTSLTAPMPRFYTWPSRRPVY